VLLSGVWGTPHLEISAKHNRKAKNNNNAFLLLFFALRQILRSHIGVTKQVAPLFVHPVLLRLKQGC